MDVTSVNFDSLVPEIEEVIRTCDFVAFDGEFTGIGDQSPNSELVLGTYEDYYHITKDKVSPFQLIQVGLSLFKRVEDSSSCVKSIIFTYFRSRINITKMSANFCANRL